MQVLKKLNMTDSKKRNKTLILLIAVLLWLIILVGVVFYAGEYKALIGSMDINEITSSVVALSVIAGFTTMLYLSKNDKVQDAKIDNLFVYSELLKEKGANPKMKETKESSKEVSPVLTSDDKDVDDENTANEIKHTFLASEERIKIEIKNLKRRATINLSLGVSLSIAALLVFFFLVYNEKPDEDYQKVFLHFAPRVGLVVFVELLAYFFLKLYKSTLTSIQYYHNELTNIETRKIAAIVAIKHCKEDKIWQTVEYLLKVERNVLIKDKETTMQMEMLKLQAERDSSVLSSTQSVLERMIDKWTNK